LVKPIARKRIVLTMDSTLIILMLAAPHASRPGWKIFWKEVVIMENNKEIGKLSLTISPDALKEVVASGRLLELADTISNLAAAQIQSQLVNQVASGALKDGLKAGASVGVSFIFDEGDFGTPGPRPHFGIIKLSDALGTTVLRRIATEAAAEVGAGR